MAEYVTTDSSKQWDDHHFTQLVSRFSAAVRQNNQQKAQQCLDEDRRVVNMVCSYLGMKISHIIFILKGWKQAGHGTSDGRQQIIG